MAKSGTTQGRAAQFKAAAAQTHKGPGVKNVAHGAHRVPHPSSGGRTAPIKGSNRGGV